MGDTISIPDQTNKVRPHKPSPPPKVIPSKAVLPDTTVTPPPQLASPATMKKSKYCQQCNKEGKQRKLRIANRFPCNKCNTDFCSDHIGAHDCDFDHHEHHKTQITKKNPVIQFKKIDKI